jgi:cytochrome c556
MTIKTSEEYLMKLLKVTVAGILALGVGTTALVADSHDAALKGAVKARQAQMSLYAHNLGALGAMAKGAVDYDSAAAQAAADNLAALATMSQAGFWLPGSDSESIEGSRALPALWGADSKGREIGMQFVEATMTMKAAAGTDLASLQGAMGAVGGSCGACHKAYRAPK